MEVNRFPSHFKGQGSGRVRRGARSRRTPECCCSARSTVRRGSWTRWQVASPTTAIPVSRSVGTLVRQRVMGITLG